jgi:hypothetical protein
MSCLLNRIEKKRADYELYALLDELEIALNTVAKLSVYYLVQSKVIPLMRNVGTIICAPLVIKDGGV